VSKAFGTGIVATFTAVKTAICQMRSLLSGNTGATSENIDSVLPGFAVIGIDGR
jgi:hypothetical protein